MVYGDPVKTIFMCSWHYCNAAQVPVYFGSSFRNNLFERCTELIDRLPRDNAPSLSTFLGHLSGSKAPTTQRVYLRGLTGVKHVDFAHSQPMEFQWLVSQLPDKSGRIEIRGGIGPRCHRLVA